MRVPAALLLLVPALLGCETRVGAFSRVTGSTGGSAGLTGLSLSAGALSPPFSAGNTSYTASVPNTTTSVTVTASAPAGAAIRVNGTDVTPGSASPPIPLAVGGNVINITVTVSGGSSRSYVVNVTRAG